MCGTKGGLQAWRLHSRLGLPSTSSCVQARALAGAWLQGAKDALCNTLHTD